MIVIEKVVLTGASDGIGKAIALEFARRGHALGLVARRGEMLAAVKSECERLGAANVMIEAVDVADEAKFEAALARLDDTFGGATIFIANAGITGRSTMNEDSWKQVKQCFQVNIMAAIHGLEFMKVRMVRRKSGILCGVTSIAAARGMPTTGGYSTSKAALGIHLETLRLDLKPHGVSVVNVAPGFVDTPMTKKNAGKMPFLMQPDLAAKVFVNGILARKSFVVAPRPWRILYPILQMLPRPIFDYLAQRSYQKIRG